MANFKIVHVDLDTGELFFRPPISGTPESFVSKLGDTMVGFLTLHADPVDPLHAATKQYVDDTVSGGGGVSFLPTTGGTMSGFLTLNSDPTDNLHAAPKQYVDHRIANITHTHEQTNLAAIWSVFHGKDTDNFIVQVFIDGELVIPQSVVVVDEDNIDIHLSSPQVGKANFVFWS